VIARNHEATGAEVKAAAEQYLETCEDRARWTCARIAHVLHREPNPRVLIDPLGALDEDARHLATIVALRDGLGRATNHPAREVAQAALPPPLNASADACPGGDYYDSDEGCYPGERESDSWYAIKWGFLYCAAIVAACLTLQAVGLIP